MDVDLSKNYLTQSGCKVKLYEIIDGSVLGAYFEPSLSRWMPTAWDLAGQRRDVWGAVIPTSHLNLHEVVPFKCEELVKIIHGNEVEYFGVKLNVDPEINYIATDSDGEVWGYVNKPDCGSYGWDSTGGTITCLAEVKLLGDWKQSLLEIN